MPFLDYKRYKIKAYIKSNPILYRFVIYIKRFCGQNNKNFLCNKSTDLCLEAYPSSANSFLCRVLKYSNKGLKIGQHTHSIANIKIALKYNIPVVAIIRNTLDAISSRVVRFNKKVERCTMEYIFRIWSA